MNIHEYATELDQATSIKKMEGLLRGYLNAYHFNSFAITFYSGHVKTGRKLRYDFVSEALRPWHVYYLEQGYADIDRTLEYASTNTLPMLWDVHEQLAAAKNNREQYMREESIRYGIHKGLSIPIYGINQDLVMLTLHQRQSETCLQDYQNNQYEWMSATLLFYHHIKRILNFDQRTIEAYALTRREEQCLLLTAKSWRVEKIAKELEISTRTVNFHLQNANKKMGTNNKYQSINKYLQFTDRKSS